MGSLVGREDEKEQLTRLFKSPKAEFLAVYGRRRIGKTYLITEFFRDKGIFFEVTGAANASTKKQLGDFHEDYCAMFKAEDSLPPPKDWSEALRRLATTCKKLEGAERIVLFFDELPWLASPRSGFLSALNYFWNRHASRMPNVLLIVCGSAASWMIKKVINDRGGLHGRLSAQMRLLPFTLAETEQYLQAYGTELPRKQICELYMVLGGVPKYLSYIQRGRSATQIINELCFTAQAPLLTEFHKLYASLFDGSENHIAVIRALAGATRSGLSRSELVQNLSKGGGASKVLEELEECGFISGQPGLGKQKRDRFYRLTDEYSLFYLRWIDQVKSTLLQNAEPDYWNQRRGTPAWNNWAGRAFESLCLKHAVQIKRALAIGGVITTQGHWEYRPTRKSDEEGAEIDLVIDRADNCVNLCEIKFSANPYLITKKYADDLERKKRVFRERTNSRKGLFTTLITPHGLKDTPHAHAVVDRAITLDSLFS